MIILLRDGDGWRPASAVRFETVSDRIVRIGDYLHCRWVLPAARSVLLADSPRGVSPVDPEPSYVMRTRTSPSH